MNKIVRIVVALSLAASGSLFAQIAPAPARPAPGNSAQARPSPDAQDFNTTRSNRQNSAISTAQDFNTTRSNRQNSALAKPGQDFNTTRSNRQNSALKAPPAQDFNTVRSNRQNSN